MSAAKEKPLYLDSIHILRGLAALSVVFEHVIGREPFSQFNRTFSFLEPWGNYGVLVFFCISGIVLPLSLSKNYSLFNLPQFLLRRVVRIEPTYFASILIAIIANVIMSYFAPNSNIVLPTLKQLGLHIAYLIPFSESNWIVSAYWTLAIEFQFYIVIGLLTPLLKRIGKCSPDTALFCTSLFSLFIFLAPAAPQVGLFKYSPFFAMGMSTAFRFTHYLPLWKIALALIICCGIGYFSPTPFGYSIPSPLGYLFTGIVACLCIASYPIRVASQRWYIRPFWFLGSISYSWYVTHQIVASAQENAGRFLLRINPSLENGIFLNLIPILSFAFSILLAWTLWSFVEKPTMALSKRLHK